MIKETKRRLLCWLWNEVSGKCCALPVKKLLYSFCCKTLLLFKQRWKILQGGCSDIMMCFLPSLKKCTQIYLPGRQILNSWGFFCTETKFFLDCRRRRCRNLQNGMKGDRAWDASRNMALSSQVVIFSFVTRRVLEVSSFLFQWWGEILVKSTCCKKAFFPPSPSQVKWGWTERVSRNKDVVLGRSIASLLCLFCITCVGSRLTHPTNI